MEVPARADIDQDYIRNSARFRQIVLNQCLASYGIISFWTPQDVNVPMKFRTAPHAPDPMGLQHPLLEKIVFVCTGGKQALPASARAALIQCVQELAPDAELQKPLPDTGSGIAEADLENPVHKKLLLRMAADDEDGVRLRDLYKTLCAGFPYSFFDAASDDPSTRREMRSIFCADLLPDSKAFFAVEEGRPVGFLVLNYEHSASASAVKIVEHYFQPASRSRGHGAALMQAAKDWAVVESRPLTADIEYAGDLCVHRLKLYGEVEVNEMKAIAETCSISQEAWRVGKTLNFCKWKKCLKLPPCGRFCTNKPWAPCRHHGR